MQYLMIFLSAASPSMRGSSFVKSYHAAFILLLKDSEVAITMHGDEDRNMVQRAITLNEYWECYTVLQILQ